MDMITFVIGNFYHSQWDDLMYVIYVIWDVSPELFIFHLCMYVRYENDDSIYDIRDILSLGELYLETCLRLPIPESRSRLPAP